MPAIATVDLANAVFKRTNTCKIQTNVGLNKLFVLKHRALLKKPFAERKLFL